MDINIHYEVENIQNAYDEYVTMAEYKTLDSDYYTCKYCGEDDIAKLI